MLAALRVVACAFAALVVPSTALAETVTIKLTSYLMLESQQLVKPKDRPVRGDTIAFRDLLVNRGLGQFGRNEGHAVAWDEGVIRYTSATATSIEVLATFPGIGTITYAGPLLDGRDGEMVVPIVSGTGAFQGARGTVTIGHGGESSPNTFVVSVPGDPPALAGLAR